MIMSAHTRPVWPLFTAVYSGKRKLSYRHITLYRPYGASFYLSFQTLTEIYCPFRGETLPTILSFWLLILLYSFFYLCAQNFLFLLEAKVIILKVNMVKSMYFVLDFKLSGEAVEWKL